MYDGRICGVPRPAGHCRPCIAVRRELTSGRLAVDNAGVKRALDNSPWPRTATVFVDVPPMLAFRLKQARLAARLTLDELAARLAVRGRPLSKAALSKFELGKTRPTAANLLALAGELGVTPGHLLSHTHLQLDWLAFRKIAALADRAIAQVQAATWRHVEHQVWVEVVVGVDSHMTLPPPRKVDQALYAEAAATELRSAWGLGNAPIESLTEAAEDHGVFVVELDGCDGEFHGFSAMASGGKPVIITAAATLADRKRFTLGHELGHVVMDTVGLPEKVQEGLVNRFAGALLVPRAAVQRELGTKRRWFELGELALLKRKYGMSMQAWMRRARDVDVIDAGEYRRLCVEVSRRGWCKTEPAGFDGPESPQRATILLLRALAEGLVTPTKAEELAPGATRDIEDLSPRVSARTLLRVDASKRGATLEAAAAALEADYAVAGALRLFDAMDRPIEDAA